jgi:hypothetical protein
MATKTMVAGLNSVTGYASYCSGLSLRVNISLCCMSPVSLSADSPTLKH